VKKVNKSIASALCSMAEIYLTDAWSVHSHSLLYFFGFVAVLNSLKSNSKIDVVETELVLRKMQKMNVKDF
jgi:hypothetical protein